MNRIYSHHFTVDFIQFFSIFFCIYLYGIYLFLCPYIHISIYIPIHISIFSIRSKFKLNLNSLKIKNNFKIIFKNYFRLLLHPILHPMFFFESDFCSVIFFWIKDFLALLFNWNSFLLHDSYINIFYCIVKVIWFLMNINWTFKFSVILLVFQDLTSRGTSTILYFVQYVL